MRDRAFKTAICPVCKERMDSYVFYRDLKGREKEPYLAWMCDKACTAGSGSREYKDIMSYYVAR
tara:strand:- start:950 stop:1141 length:192 start_codon:yes stop_codon:yes gene_type:complete